MFPVFLDTRVRASPLPVFRPGRNVIHHDRDRFSAEFCGKSVVIIRRAALL